MTQKVAARTNWRCELSYNKRADHLTCRCYAHAFRSSSSRPALQEMLASVHKHALACMSVSTRLSNVAQQRSAKNVNWTGPPARQNCPHSSKLMLSLPNFEYSACSQDLKYVKRTRRCREARQGSSA